MTWHNELAQLTSALLDDSITIEEAARLEQLVDASEGARQQFLDLVLLQGELYWEFTRGVDEVASKHGADFRPGARAEPSSPRQPSARHRPSVRHRPSMPPRPRMPRRPRTVLGISWRGPLVVVAGLLLLVTALYLVGIGPHDVGRVVERLVERAQFASPEIKTDHETVQIAALADADWSAGGAPDANGRVPLGGNLLLSQGLAEVVFPFGTRVILQGPAELQSLSAQSAHLSAGQLTARVPPEAAGFVIDTPDAKIVDLGTEFCVAVEKGKWTEVEVVSGHVDVSSKAGAAEEAWSRRLAAGEALRIVSSVAGDPIQVQPIPFGTRDYAREIEPH